MKVTISILDKSLFYTIQVGRDSPVVAEMIVGSRREMEEETGGTYLAIFPYFRCQSSQEVRSYTLPKCLVSSIFMGFTDVLVPY